MHSSFTCDEYCTACFFHLRNIAKIREYLSTADTETLVHAFITSKLDSCNSLLYGLPESLIDRLQNVQNSATRLITRNKKIDHITLVMKRLHWLPIKQRIVYKIPLITYKALNGLGPSYICDMLQPLQSTINLRLSMKGFLSVPPIKLVNYIYMDRDHLHMLHPNFGTNFDSIYSSL